MLQKEKKTNGLSIYSNSMQFPFYTSRSRSSIERSNYANSMNLLFAEPEIAYSEENVNPDLQEKSINVFAARFFIPDVLYDTALVSQSLASRLVARKINTQQINLREDQFIDEEIYSEEFGMELFRKIQKKPVSAGIFTNLIDKRLHEENALAEYVKNVISKKWVINRNKKLTLIGENGKKNFFRSSIKHKFSCIIRNIEYVSTTPGFKKAIITYESILPFQKGDKICTQTGHKFTGDIRKNEDMPTINGQTVELVWMYAIGKRETPSVILEEVSSLYVKEFGLESYRNLKWSVPSELCEQIEESLQSVGKSTKAEMDYLGNQYANIPHGYIRIFRHNHNTSEILKYTVESSESEKFNPSSAIKFNYLLSLSLKNRECDKLLSYMDKNLRASIAYRLFNNLLDCLKNPITDDDFLRSIEINKPLNGTLLNRLQTTGNVANIQQDFSNTVFDERITNFNRKPYFEIIVNGELICRRIPCIATDFYAGLDDKYIIRQITVIINTILSKMVMFKLTKNNGDIQNELNILDRQYLDELKKLFINSSETIISPYVGECIYAAISSNVNLPYNTVGIPYHVYKKFMRSNISFNKSKEKRVMIYTQPFHCNKHLVSMCCVPVHGDTIQLNPNIVSIFNRDFDGDCMYVYIPNDQEAYKDLDKIKIENIIADDTNYSNSYLTKVLKSIKEIVFEDDDVAIDLNGKSKFQQELSIVNSHLFDGISSTWDNSDYEILGPYFLDVWSNPITKEKIQEYSIRAGYNAAAIKIQTAISGAIGLQFISWCHFKGKDSNNGMMLYHFMAQSSLYSKHGQGSESLKLIEIYNLAKRKEVDPNNKQFQESYENYMNRLIVAMEREPVEFPRMKKDFLDFLIDMQKFDSTAEFNNYISPVFAIVRNTLTSDTIVKYILGEKYRY